MGAWGTGSFENDDALEWISSARDGDLEQIRSALAPVAEPDGAYLDAPEGAHALAAAEAVASLRGAPPVDLPERVGAWIDTLSREFDDALLVQARAATDRVVTAPSELLDHWEDMGDDDATAWRAQVADLRDRLG